MRELMTKAMREEMVREEADRVADKVRAAMEASGLSFEMFKRGFQRACAKATAKTKTKTITNASQVASAAPGVHRIGNAVGLYLKKSGFDTGSYFFRYRFGRKRREMGLGPISGPTAITLAEARDKAGELARARKTSDPIEARRQAKAASIVAAEAEAAAAKRRVTFAQAAETYLETNAPKWKHSGARAGWWGPIRRYAFPAIGHLNLDDIEAAHVAAAMDAAVEAGAPTMAKKVRSSVEQVIKLAVALGQRDARLGNPAKLASVKLITKLGKTKTKHYRRIKLEDAPAAFQRLKELAAAPAPASPPRGPRPMDDIAFAAWVFMIATAARPTEALKAKWTEIDLVKNLWTLPSERMKGSQEHSVPLSSTALWALELMQARRTGDAVFPGRGGASLGDSSFADAAKKAGVDLGTPHSWRSHFRDWCGDIGRVDRDLAEAALAHTLGAVEKAYRRGSAIEARREPMERYALWLTSTGAGARVVGFPARAS
jgi:integrase